MRAALVLLLMVCCGCGVHKPLPYLGEVPPFQLTDQHGRPFTRASLDGHVWVADFIYTTCPGPCPRMSSHLRTVQDTTSGAIHLVSFTVDPDTDTPPVLAAYAAKFGAIGSRWSFLTGPKDILNVLGQQGFRLGTGLDHSTRFVLVDQHARIRAYYGIADGNPARAIAADAASLLRRKD